MVYPQIIHVNSCGHQSFICLACLLRCCVPKEVRVHDFADNAMLVHFNGGIWQTLFKFFEFLCKFCSVFHSSILLFILCFFFVFTNCFGNTSKHFLLFNQLFIKLKTELRHPTKTYFVCNLPTNPP